VSDWLTLARPYQWTKNGFVLAPVVFSGRVTDPLWLQRALAAFVLYCLVAAGVYALNDAVDAPADRLHPSKRDRPVAAGRIAPRAAVLADAGWMAVGIAGMFVLDVRAGLLGVLYGVSNVVYSTWLKHVVILDVFAIAGFFLLRLLVGSVVVDVRPSVWLLLCGGLLALYLGVTKRRCELAAGGDASHSQRAVLSSYSTAFLDQMSTIVSSVTIVAYIMYTLSSETARDLGSESLAYSSAFVLYGIFRYQYLVQYQNAADPARTVFTDPGLLITVGLWAVYCGAVIYGVF